MDIYYKIPYSVNKDLGAAYNQAMHELPRDDDWCALLDYDTQFLHPNFGKQIHDIVKAHPGTGIFTAVSNRTGNSQQRYAGIISENADMRHHLRIAEKLYNSQYANVKVLERHISGYLMIVQKRTWKEIKFRERKNATNILGVDHDFGDKVLASGRNIVLMKGVYIFHTYRLLQGIKHKDHLK